ncbi:uncharacterized protein CCR75_002119 [Bremia lactucae]|uniref:Uncharacterized protein n=1 Tax=Bremia lactucae TaxID=4779 RepID=A0A976FED7_BRELC|nr:hypothetical protein CCR75_002119 [Bremia lactucae]
MSSAQQQQEAQSIGAVENPSEALASQNDGKKAWHMRRCDGRDICSCELRLASACFQKNLVEKAAKKRRENPSLGPPVKSNSYLYRKVTNIQQLELELKLCIAAFLAPTTLGRLGLTNKTFKRDVDIMAKQVTCNFLAKTSLTNLLKQMEPKAMESWSQLMHKQMTCIQKIFVFYTAYKTGGMRQQNPQWAFGAIDVNPNEPQRVILPNTWTFHGHNPWLRRRGNGKDGEWLLTKKYRPSKAPKDFLEHVKTWASSLQPGSMLAIAYQNAGSMEPAWWEAQAWYIWRGDGKQYPAVVYDPETEARIEVHPNDLLEYFMAHPLHVIDVTTQSVCRQCASQNRTFKYCHLEKGHLML